MMARSVDARIVGEMCHPSDIADFAVFIAAAMVGQGGWQAVEGVLFVLRT